MSEFYGAPVTDSNLAGIPDARPLECGGWLRDFPKLRLYIAALNTSERENDKERGGYLSPNQAQSLINRWCETDADGRIKIIALHHNPVSTTAANTKWTIDWLRARSQSQNIHTNDGGPF